jgi:hypothetical protein
MRVETSRREVGNGDINIRIVNIAMVLKALRLEL